MIGGRWGARRAEAVHHVNLNTLYISALKPHPIIDPAGDTQQEDKAEGKEAVRGGQWTERGNRKKK